MILSYQHGSPESNFYALQLGWLKEPKRGAWHCLSLGYLPSVFGRHEVEADHLRILCNLGEKLFSCGAALWKCQGHLVVGPAASLGIPKHTYICIKYTYIHMYKIYIHTDIQNIHTYIHMYKIYIHTYV